VKNVKQGVALTGRNHTGPACSVGCWIHTRPADGTPTVHAPGWPDCRQRSHAPGGRLARMPAASQTMPTDDASQQSNAGP